MSTTTTYANGTALVSSALTQDQIDVLLQQMTLDMLGLPVTPSSSDVRLEWPSEGAPFQNRTDNVCYLSCVVVDQEYDKIRELALLEGDATHLTELFNYTRSWTIKWCFYGPKSTDNARAVKSALFIDSFTDQLSLSQLFPVSDYPEPVRAPELIDGQWFERVDYEAIFSEFVTETISIQTVASVEVIVNDETGVIADFTVSID
jgi:hypothetical protein